MICTKNSVFRKWPMPPNMNHANTTKSPAYLRNCNLTPLILLRIYTLGPSLPSGTQLP